MRSLASALLVGACLFAVGCGEESPTHHDSGPGTVPPCGCTHDPCRNSCADSCNLTNLGTGTYWFCTNNNVCKAGDNWRCVYSDGTRGCLGELTCDSDGGTWSIPFCSATGCS